MLPFTPKLTLDRRRFRLEVEDPSRHQAAQNRDVGDDDGHVVFNVANAVVDRVGPVSLEFGVEAVAVLQVDLSAANGCHPV